MRRTLVLVIAALLIAVGVGASAFSTGYADRTATIDVVSDPNGLIGLEDGNSGDLVGISGDELTIDFSNGSATGANANGYFEIGDTSNANETAAFNITNNDDVAHDLSLNYTLDGGDDSNDHPNVTYEVYDSGNTKIVTASEEGAGTPAVGTLGSGNTAHVVIKVDTTGLGSGDDLSGNLRIKLS